VKAGKLGPNTLIKPGPKGKWFRFESVVERLNQLKSQTPALEPAPPPLPPALPPLPSLPNHQDPFANATTPAVELPDHNRRLVSATLNSAPARSPFKSLIYWGAGVVVVVLLVLLLTGLVALISGSRLSLNPATSLANAHLQAVFKSIASDPRNGGITASAYYQDTFDHSVVVFDLQQVAEGKSRLDVFRFFLGFSQQLKNERFRTVELAFRGKTKFRIDGSYFNQLGSERDFQNPAYTIRTFPENLKTTSGINAYPSWSGGVLGVLNHQMEDFTDFHNKWYLDEHLRPKP
jgi:hypothetical protein